MSQRDPSSSGTSPYPSVSAWVHGNSRLPRLEADDEPLLSIANYVDVHFMGRDHLRKVFTTAPNKTQRECDSFHMPIFSTDALKATLEKDDPEHFEVLATSLTIAQWDQLTLAANLSESYPWGGAFYVKCRSFNSLLSNQNEDVRVWAKEMFYRFTNCNPALYRVFERKFGADGKPTLELNCRDFIVYLHHCDAIADVLSPLCDLGDKCRDIFPVREFEMLGEFYESIRPGADLYRTIPESVIKNFIEVGAALHLINDSHKEALLRLAFAVSEVGVQLDDNPARMDNDSDTQVDEWWKWTEGYFDYQVHYGLTPMHSLEFLEKYTDHISGACIAFDPSIGTNLVVLKLMDDGWASRGFGAEPIIKDINSVHADLVLVKALLVDALHQCRDTTVEFVLPTRLQTPCKSMPKLPLFIKSPLK